MPEPRERSISGEVDVRPLTAYLLVSKSTQDSDIESQNGDHRDDSNPPGKPGRKKNPKWASIFPITYIFKTCL